MTSRAPLETLEAASEESPASPSTGERVEDDSNGAAMTRAEQSEASISKTLEAILSKTDDEDESPLTAEEGAISDSSAAGTTTDGAANVGAHDHAEAGPSISVDAMFDVDVDLDHPLDQHQKWSLPPPGDDRPVGDLLDEVAEALNVQAAESRERAIGPTPDAKAPGVASTPLVARSTEFEFEDPEDGPTTLNAMEAANGITAAASSDRDDDEEAVVLGPATRRGDSHPTSTAPGAAIRATLPAPPMPGSRAPGQSRPHTATPFAGLPAATLPMFPAPPPGRARLPTPVPGHLAEVPSPASGRSTLPSGSALCPMSEAASPTGLGLPDSSRRIPRVTGSGATLGASAGADESRGRHGLGLVSEPLNAALSGASTILKKDVRFRLASLAAIVVVTFTGGILIGRAVMRGKDPEAPPAVARAVDPAPASPLPVVAPAKSAPAPTPAASATPDTPKIEPVAAPPTVAEAAPPGVGPMQFDPQPIHKRRARRSGAAPNDDPALGLAPKGGVRVASIAAPPPPVAKSTTAGKPAPKKKSTWHDPFAD